MHVTLLLAVGIFPNFLRCAVRPVQPMDEGSVEAFLHGIDRLCNATSFSEVLLLNNDETDPTGVHSALKVRLAAHRPVSLRSVSFLGNQNEKTCVVVFFSTMELARVVEKQMEMMALFVAVLPEDMLEPMSDFFVEMYLCVMHYFAYSRTTLDGSWSADRNGVRYNSLEAVGPGGTSGGDLRGQPVVFLNVDVRQHDNKRDVEIGRTIAKRHNGSFAVAQNLMQCADYLFSPMYMGYTFTFVSLPQMSEMCIVVPRSQRKSIFAILIDPFDYTSWAAFAVTIGVVSCVLSLFGESYRRLHVVLISLELLMTAINGPTRRYGGRFEVRIMGLFMMMNIVLFSCYQSLVISFMSAGRFEPELDTIDQINDTCQFQYDHHLQGSFGYRFRHNFRTFEVLQSVESRWKHKVCQVSICYGKGTSGMEGDETYYPHLFRISKVRLHSTVTMYAIFNYSPMRDLIRHYTAAFFEGHLHSFPLLLARKEILGEQQDTIYDLKVEAMSVSELQIVWIVFLIGCLSSAAVFMLELTVAYAPQKIRFAKRKVAEMARSYHWKKPWHFK